VTVEGLCAPVRGAPTVRVLDARNREWDERRLRAEARALTARTGAPFSSRSYRYPYALATWHNREVGVDLEVVDAANAALSDVICTETERRLLAHAQDGALDRSSLWSGKEALAKALGDALLYDPSRLASPLVWLPERLSAPMPHPEAFVTRAAGRWRAAPLVVPDGHVGWLCWVP
jgi:hypothetical protein